MLVEYHLYNQLNLKLKPKNLDYFECYIVRVIVLATWHALAANISKMLVEFVPGAICAEVLCLKVNQKIITGASAYKYGPEIWLVLIEIWLFLFFCPSYFSQKFVARPIFRINIYGAYFVKIENAGPS